MSDEYQLRKDIDKLFADFYNLETGSVNVLRRGDLDDIRESIEDLYNQMSNHHHIEFDEIDERFNTHLHDDWSVISLTNGTLCVNNRLKLAQINYLKNNVTLTADTWVTVETVSDLVDYPPYMVNDGNYYVSCSNPDVTVRLYKDGTIKANCTVNGSYAIAFNDLYHFDEV